MQVHIRWMIANDLPTVLEIENFCFQYPWTRDDFVRQLRTRNVIGLVAEGNDSVVGYMLWEILKDKLHLLNFAVAPECRLEGVGRQMVEKLKSKLSPERRNRIILEVRETNLDAQLFFRACGFTATRVLPDFYDDTDEDAYRMAYRVHEPSKLFAPHNRIGHLTQP